LKHKSVTFAGSAASPDQFPRDGLPEVAFLGRSNVGKSSLLNAMAGEKALARVSSAPGLTRTVNFFRVRGAERPGGGGRSDLYLVDLPGYGYAKAPRAVRDGFERLAVSYLAGREQLRLCVFIVDARHDPTERDFTLRAWLDHHALPYVVAANKIDSVAPGEREQVAAALGRGLAHGSRELVPVSATRGTGIETLWNAIRGAALAREQAGATARRGHDAP
jgi:GTP-binding protein